jgi:glutathione S-transferase
MKLYQSPTSPYVRMARATAALKGIADQIELVNARADQDAYEMLNPLNKVPCLVTDDGEVLIESRLICQYLDSLTGESLYLDGAARRKVLQREAIVHGILDAVVAQRMDTRKTDSTPSPWWQERQQRKIDIGLRRIESELPAYTDTETILPILLCCMCHFMDRVSDFDWRKNHPGLAKWYEAYSREPHMAATEIKD